MQFFYSKSLYCRYKDETRRPQFSVRCQAQVRLPSFFLRYHRFSVRLICLRRVVPLILLGLSFLCHQPYGFKPINCQNNWFSAHCSRWRNSSTSGKQHTATLRRSCHFYHIAIIIVPLRAHVNSIIDMCQKLCHTKNTEKGDTGL